MTSMATLKLPGLATAELLQLRQTERLRLQLADAALLPLRWLPKPVTLKILMLVDDGISFNQFYFGLSEVLDTLRTNPEWWVNFEITRAHRHGDPNPPATPAGMALYGPHHENFHFGQAGFDINKYDEVWFYGFNSGEAAPGSCAPIAGIPPNALTDGELAILYRWMNEKDGGVFAVGDHEDLGEALCSRIPRVRSMRKWKFGPGVPAADRAPDNNGLDRHDTLRPGYDRPGTPLDEATRYTFDDESDDLPMPLRLRWYPWRYQCKVGGRILHPQWYRKLRVPHPLMCGTKGPINVFPDHPHEGEVRVPTVLGDAPAFCGYGFREYPDHGGSPLSPQIVAWASVRDDITAGNSFKGAANAKEFGAVGAYDGHCVGVGRVVVDSTWHHWFDVNLTGRMFFGSDTPGSIETGDSRKLNGFNDTPAGVATLNRIRNYFRNVAIWLAPPARQRDMACAALWGAIHRFPLRADLRHTMDIEEIGHHAISILIKAAGRCQVVRWWEVLADPKRLHKLFDFDRYEQPPELLERVDAIMIGALLQAMLILRAKLPQGRHPNEAELLKLAEGALDNGWKRLTEEAERGQKVLQSLTEGLR
jgi:hypothetical protein